MCPKNITCRQSAAYVKPKLRQEPIESGERAKRWNNQREDWGTGTSMDIHTSH